ncbi:hypothetical protein YC2023_096948 [Brassica napus]
MEKHAVVVQQRFILWSSQEQYRGLKNQNPLVAELIHEALVELSETVNDCRNQA